MESMDIGPKAIRDNFKKCNAKMEVQDIVRNDRRLDKCRCKDKTAQGYGETRSDKMETSDYSGSLR